MPLALDSHSSIMQNHRRSWLHVIRKLKVISTCKYKPMMLDTTAGYIIILLYEPLAKSDKYQLEINQFSWSILASRLDGFCWLINLIITMTSACDVANVHESAQASLQCTLLWYSSSCCAFLIKRAKLLIILASKIIMSRTLRNPHVQYIINAYIIL